MVYSSVEFKLKKCAKTVRNVLSLYYCGEHVNRFMYTFYEIKHLVIAFGKKRLRF
jgi:hypothetical protein